jgi:hypothetical protein
MASRVAQLVLRLHILKKAAAQRLPERLRYLLLARRVHGAVLLFWVPFTFCLLFVACWVFFPHLGVTLHLDEAGKEGTRDYWASTIFFSLSVVLVLGCWVILWTRELLASLFILNFVTYLDTIRRRTRPSALDWTRR